MKTLNEVVSAARGRSALILATLIGCMAFAHAENLVSNPGFEAGLEGWRVAHAGSDDPEASYRIVTGDAHNGNQCVKYEKSGGENKNNHLDQIVAVEPETHYTVSAWMKGDGRLAPLLSVEGMDWRPIGQEKCAPSTEWQKVSVTFNSMDRSQVRIIWYGGSMGKRYEGYPGGSCLDDVEVRPATDEEVRAYKSLTRTDTTGWFEFPLRWDDIIPAPLLAVKELHDPPAGKHGFVSARDGHLYFANGKRARFWGVCCCGRSAFPTHEEAEKIAARLAKCGINIVRLHALEVQIFDEDFDDTRHLSAQMLNRLDYFVAQLKNRGIYLFLDWRTAWRTRKGDGLGPRSLYQWTMLDERFVDLNRNYARLLFLHENPYTGNRYVDEPAVAVFEIVNERDLFSVFTGKYEKDPDTARLKDALKGLWNEWLLKRYGDWAGLAEAWTNAAGECGLSDAENPAAGTVEIPLPAHSLGAWERSGTGPTGTARGSDALLFLYEIQTSYFTKMRDFLRGLGVKTPISGTNWHMHIRPNARSNAQLDFTENHCYWDHAQPWGPGRNKYTRTNNIPMVRQDPTAGDKTTIEKLYCGKMPDKPFIVSEWNFDSPNEYRCEGPIETAAYGALQDWDGLICYCYYGNWGDSWDNIEEAQSLGMYLGSEEIYNDPAIICQFPIAAAIFLRGDVSAAKRVIDVGYSNTDAFYAQGAWGQEMDAFGFLPFLHRVRHRYFDDEYAGDADVVVASGLSASGSYAKAQRAILFSDNPSADLHGKSMGRHQLVAGLYPEVRFEDRPKVEVSFDNSLWPWGKIELPLDPGLKMSTLPKGARAFGTDANKQLCLGFIDERRCVAPGAFALRASDDRWLYHLFTGVMKEWNLAAPCGQRTETGGQPTLVSDTGELSWNPKDGIFTVSAARTQGAVGFLGGAHIKLPNVEIAAETRYCSIMLASMDDRPIGEAKRMLLTAVARCENTGQFWENIRTTIPAEGRGRAPVLVEPVEAAVTISSASAGAPVSVHALNPTGMPKDALEVETGTGAITIRLGKEHATVFYAIEFNPQE